MGRREGGRERREREEEQSEIREGRQNGIKYDGRGEGIKERRERETMRRHFNEPTCIGSDRHH